MRPLVYVMPIVLLVPATGCRNSTEDRLVEMARDHAVRQAETCRQMADLQKEVAEGSRKLVESDAKAREELTALQHDLRSDQAEIGRERDKMEAERRQIAVDRHRDPIIAAIVLDIGVVLACLLPLALCVYVLWSARRDGDSDSAVAELFVRELVSSEPKLLLHDRPQFPGLAGEPPDRQAGDGHRDKDGPID